MFFKKNILITPKTETNNEKHTVDLGKGTLEFKKILYLSKPSDTRPTMSLWRKRWKFLRGMKEFYFQYK